MENCFTQKSFFSDWLFYGDHYPSSIKQQITKETFLFATFFHISLLWSFSFYSFLNTTTLFIDLMVQICLEILIYLKHAWNNCDIHRSAAWLYRCIHVNCKQTIKHTDVIETLKMCKWAINRHYICTWYYYNTYADTLHNRAHPLIHIIYVICE